MSQTNYYVLAVEDPGDMLQMVGQAEAGTGEGAIRKVTAANELNLAGRFVAVPVRNWTEIEFETVERDPIVTANYISERRTRGPQPTPGQTSIEDEIESAELAAEIEGETEEERLERLALDPPEEVTA